jgi:hypothetical protein
VERNIQEKKQKTRQSRHCNAIRPSLAGLSAPETTIDTSKQQVLPLRGPMAPAISFCFDAENRIRVEERERACPLASLADQREAQHAAAINAWHSSACKLPWSRVGYPSESKRAISRNESPGLPPAHVLGSLLSVGEKAPRFAQKVVDRHLILNTLAEYWRMISFKQFAQSVSLFPKIDLLLCNHPMDPNGH